MHDTNPRDDRDDSEPGPDKPERLDTPGAEPADQDGDGGRGLFERIEKFFSLFGWTYQSEPRVLVIGASGTGKTSMLRQCFAANVPRTPEGLIKQTVSAIEHESLRLGEGVVTFIDTPGDKAQMSALADAIYENIDQGEATGIINLVAGGFNLAGGIKDPKIDFSKTGSPYFHEAIERFRKQDVEFIRQAIHPRHQGSGLKFFFTLINKMDLIAGVDAADHARAFYGKDNEYHNYIRSVLPENCKIGLATSAFPEESEKGYYGNRRITTRVPDEIFGTDFIDQIQQSLEI